MTTPRDPFAAQSPGQGYGPPPGPGQYGPPGVQGVRTEPKAIVAIVLAVLAWTPTVPFIGAIAALVLARMARRDIRASGGRLTGLSLCRWATVMSWVHLVVVVLVALVAVALFVLPLAVSL